MLMLLGWTSSPELGPELYVCIFLSLHLKKILCYLVWLDFMEQRQIQNQKQKQHRQFLNVSQHMNYNNLMKIVV